MTDYTVIFDWSEESEYAGNPAKLVAVQANDPGDALLIARETLQRNGYHEDDLLFIVTMYGDVTELVASQK